MSRGGRSTRRARTRARAHSTSASPPAPQPMGGAEAPASQPLASSANPPAAVVQPAASPSRPVGVALAPVPERLLREGQGHLVAGRHRQAIEVFKSLAKSAPDAPWREPLQAAYQGRGRELAAKGMFREAAAILETAAALLGILPDQGLYLMWLINGGRLGKAAQLLFAPAKDGTFLPVRGPAAELLATLSLCGEEEVLAALPPAAPLAAHRVLLLEALAAWERGEGEGCLARLKQLPARSPLAPVRLLLNALLVRRDDPAQAARLLERIIPGSPLHELAQAVRATLVPAGERVAVLLALAPPGRKLAARLLGVEAGLLARLGEFAAADQPEPLFRQLLRPGMPFPETEARRACLALLPQLPRHMGAFQSRFGPLATWEQARIQALGEEHAGRVGAAIRHWERCLRELERAEEVPARSLRLALILRHLAELESHQPRGWERDEGYLERSLDHDPDDLETHLWLIRLHEERDDSREYRLAVERAVKRFPAEVRVLALAMELALQGKAFKKAAGLARTILGLDPLNAPVRRKLAEAHLAHARKQVRSGRRDLADRELAQAETVEREPVGRGHVWVMQGLLEWQAGHQEAGSQRLAAAGELMGDGVLACCLGMVEVTRLNLPQAVVALCQRELDTALKSAAPNREKVLRLASLLERWLTDDPLVTETAHLLASLLRGYLAKGIGLTLALEEVRLLCHLLLRTALHPELGRYAQEGEQRWPGDGAFLFFRLYARCQGRLDKLSRREKERLEGLLEEEGRLDERTWELVDMFLLDVLPMWLSGSGLKQPYRGRGAKAPSDPMDWDPGLEPGELEIPDEIPDEMLLEMLRETIGPELEIMRRRWPEERIRKELIRNVGRDFPLGQEVFAQLLDLLLADGNSPAARGEVSSGSRRGRRAPDDRQLKLEFDE